MKKYYLHIIINCGITYTTKDYRDEIRRLEKSRKIVVERSEKKTETGRASSALNFEKQSIRLRKGL
jgi:hypothetical protein